MSIEKLKELQTLLVQGHSCRASELLDEIVAELEQEQKPVCECGGHGVVPYTEPEACDIIERLANEIKLHELSYASLGNKLLEVQKDCINERIANAELKNFQAYAKYVHSCIGSNEMPKVFLQWLRLVDNETLKSLKDGE